MGRTGSLSLRYSVVFEATANSDPVDASSSCRNSLLSIVVDDDQGCVQVNNTFAGVNTKTALR